MLDVLCWNACPIVDGERYYLDTSIDPPRRAHLLTGTMTAYRKTSVKTAMQTAMMMKRLEDRHSRRIGRLSCRGIRPCNFVRPITEARIAPKLDWDYSASLVGHSLPCMQERATFFEAMKALRYKNGDKSSSWPLQRATVISIRSRLASEIAHPASAHMDSEMHSSA